MNPYTILGLDGDCTSKEVKDAYRRLSKILHPDAGGDPESFIELNICYSTLIDPERRQLYDEQGIMSDSSVNELEEQANASFKEFTESWIDLDLRNGNKVPIEDYFNGRIQQLEAEIQSGVSQLRKAIKLLEKKIDDVICNDPINGVHAILEYKINQYKTSLNRIEKSKLVLEILKKKCRAYKSKKEDKKTTFTYDDVINSVYSQRKFGGGIKW